VAEAEMLAQPGEFDYISSPELRRRIHVGFNKGEAKNAPARAMFFNRLGELSGIERMRTSGIAQAG
jgi:TnpA family transposase